MNTIYLILALCLTTLTSNAQLLNFKKPRTVFLGSFGKNPPTINILNSTQDLEKNYAITFAKPSSYENVKSFFKHGGQNSFIYSTTYNNIDQAIKFLEKYDFDILVTSEIRDLNKVLFLETIKKLSQLLETKKAHLILDIPVSSDLPTLKKYLSNLSSISSSRISIYYPDIITKDHIQTPSSGMAAGYFYSRDLTVGSWKVCGLNCPLNTDYTPIGTYNMNDISFINDQSPIGINLLIKPRNDMPFTLFNTYTSNTTTQTELKYNSVSRTNDLVYKALISQLSWVKTATNSPSTWQKIKSDLNTVFMSYWTNKVIFGSKPEFSYFARVGLNETMTSEDISNKKIIIEFGLAYIRENQFTISKIIIQQ